jgi:hypothetical protein
MTLNDNIATAARIPANDNHRSERIFIEDVAVILGIPLRSVQTMASRGKIPSAAKLGRRSGSFLTPASSMLWCSAAKSGPSRFTSTPDLRWKLARAARGACGERKVVGSNSIWLTPKAFASSYIVTIVGLRRPFSRPLTYCWLNPEMSQNSSCVRLFSSRIRLTF